MRSWAGALAAETPIATWWPAFLVALAGAMGALVALAEGQGAVAATALLACVFVMLDFRVGVVFLIVLMPLSESALFPHNMGGITGLNPLNVLLLATLGSLSLQRASGQLVRLVPRQLAWCYVAPIVVAGLLGMRHAGEIPATFFTQNLLAFSGSGGYLRDMMLRPLLMVLFALLVAAAVARSRQPKGFLLPMLAAIWVMCALVIGFVFFSGASLAELSSSGSRGFFSPLGVHANDLGRVFAVAYALVLFTLAETREGGMKLVMLVTLGLIVLALTLTFSRGAFFGFAVVNLLFLISRRNLAALILGVLLLGGLALLAPGAVYERIATGWNGDLNALSAGRVDDIWLPLLPELLNSPFYGNGIGAVLWSAPMRSGRILEVTHPHNAYLQVLLDMGLIGFALFAAFFWHIWKTFRALAVAPDLSPLLRGFHAGAAAGLLSFLAAAFAGSSLLPCFEQVFLWFAIGMAYGLRFRRLERTSA